MKIAIGLPTCGFVKTRTVFSIIRMLKTPFWRTADYNIITKEGSVLHWNREHIVKQAIEGGCTHVLFIDSDMFFPEDAAERLYKRDKDVIGVPYNLRQFPLVSTLKKHLENKEETLWEEFPDGLVKCVAVGFGLTLIKTDVFKKLTPPWFFWESNERGEVVTGEDSWFCRNARKAGYDIWADMEIEVKHIGDYMY